MAATAGSRIAPQEVRLLLLAYGTTNAYRVMTFDEIVRAVPHAGKKRVQEALDELAQVGLVTRFSKRYCFNKTLPRDLQLDIERAVTPSGTIRIRQSKTAG